ncbi:MAG: thiamine phosphate synthase [Thiomicrorhabdus sp.]|nr:thiamine phosphate synthase [Thiomicrorhabdus sp.]
MTQSLRKPFSGLYVITDTQLMNQHTLATKVEQALKGGAQIVQFRDKVNNSQTKITLAKQLKTLCKIYQAWFIINDDIQLAKTVQADGVHIGKDDSDITSARRALGKQAIIGVSCYNDLERAQEMQELGADYVAFGRFFASKTKPNAPQADISTLTLAKKNLHIPVVAIGGITQNNGHQLIEAGADSLAVIQGVFAHQDVETQSQAIQELFN